MHITQERTLKLTQPVRKMEHRRQSKRKIVITEDIVFEILLRVPVRSLLICKCVCKFWYSLISDQHFIKSHLKLSTIKSHTDKSPLTRNKLIISINEPTNRSSDYPTTVPFVEASGLLELRQLVRAMDCYALLNVALL